jgi:hypothetical protein
MTILEFLRSHALSLPTLAKFAIAMAVIVSVPWLSLRVRLSPVVGLLLSGVVLGPHGLDLIGENRPIADFFPIFFIVTQVSLLLQPRKFRFCIVSPANRKFTWPDPTSSDAVCLGGIANQGTQKRLRFSAEATIAHLVSVLNLALHLGWPNLGANSLEASDLSGNWRNS